MAVVLLLLALLGHAVLWIALVNRIDGLVARRALCKRLTRLAKLCAVLIPLAVGFGLTEGDVAILAGKPWLRVSWAGATYVTLCWLAGIFAIFTWLGRRVLFRSPPVPGWQRSALHEIARPTVGGTAPRHLLAHTPGNQAFELDVTERGLEIARLPQALDGLRISHLSDLHLSAATGKAFFQEVVRLSNDFKPDLVAVTGDFVERDEYIDWIPDTLGRLTSRYGVYFVLGNHDVVADTARLRRTLIDCGLIHLGGRSIQTQVRGEPVTLMGNELPWFPQLADQVRPPLYPAQARPLVIALSHTPDQLPWARSCEVDLLLAGHTHGGQICLPWIGPILVPSRWGVKYASGTFSAPPTVMHVSRGISGKVPLRIYCRPELGRLVLRPPTASR